MEVASKNTYVDLTRQAQPWPDRLACEGHYPPTGFGAHQPISTGKTAAEYKTNRRIEFKLDRR